jgi:mannose/fructose-specific phosphotransferase system component IIA
MKNIILLTHGDFSKGIAQSSRFIVGAVENITPLSITLNETVEEVKGMIEKSWKDFNNQEPTVIITDLPGGSTTQAAIQFLSEHENFYLISGLNLGLLLELILAELTEDHESNLEILRNIVEGARQTITLVNDISTEDTDDLEGEL